MNNRIIVGRQSQRQALRNHDGAATDGIASIWRNLSSWWHFRA
ncbi:hypothetical protein [Snodgrassella communis]|nr:hypothetical protein [Snodgrassella communis]